MALALDRLGVALCKNDDVVAIGKDQLGDIEIRPRKPGKQRADKVALDIGKAFRVLRLGG